MNEQRIHREGMIEVIREMVPEVRSDRAVMFVELHRSGIHLHDPQSATIETPALAGHVREMRAMQLAKLLFTLASSGDPETTYTAKA